MPKLTFYGATNGVTGSAYVLETRSSRVLLECGLIQGSSEDEKANSDPFPFDVDGLDAVILSHAHLDHTGRLPKLVADGYDGPVYVTPPTSELVEIMLKDAAFLANRDTDWENRRRRRSGKPELQPLYTLDDVEAALALCDAVPYGVRSEVASGVEVCYRDAGHILGSAIVEIFVSEAGNTRKLVFSGDLGNSCAALLGDPEIVEAADVLMLEATYGDRDHRPMDQTLDELRNIVARAAETGGNILIPAFAVGRTQEILFRLGELYQQGELPQQAVFLDSPMAIATTEVYHRFQDMFNREDRATLRQGKSGSLHTFLPPLRYTSTTDESKAINRVESGAIIIAGSGMCTGGRIRHHLKHNLWRRGAHVVIVGYQARGTPGRALVDGAKRLVLAGEEIAVKADIHTLGGFSAHASQSQLLSWAGHFRDPKPLVYLIHGEPDAKVALRDKLVVHGWQVGIPAQGATIAL